MTCSQANVNLQRLAGAKSTANSQEQILIPVSSLVYCAIYFGDQILFIIVKVPMGSSVAESDKRGRNKASYLLVVTSLLPLCTSKHDCITHVPATHSISREASRSIRRASRDLLSYTVAGDSSTLIRYSSVSQMQRLTPVYPLPSSLSMTLEPEDPRQAYSRSCLESR